MPRRRRLFTPNKNKIKNALKMEPKSGQEVNTARGRLIGALMDVLDPTAAEDIDDIYEPSHAKRERRQSSSEQREYLTDEEAKKCLWKSPAKQSYVLKLFDRSVDLFQFRENSPLYPICRAWIANKPKANYSTLGSEKEQAPDDTELLGTVKLPGPEGEVVSRIPDLIPEQQQASRDNINLNYREAPPPTKEQLLRCHLTRWTAVRQSWLEQAAKVESRYEATQKVLNKINIEYINSR